MVLNLTIGPVRMGPGGNRERQSVGRGAWRLAVSVPILALPWLAGPGTDGTRARTEPGGGPVWVEREARLMGTRLRVELAAASREAGFRSAGFVLDQVASAEDRWSTWREGTALSRLNRAAPGRPVPLPHPMAPVLAELQRWVERTAGAFDPGVGPLVDAWRLRDGGTIPGPGALRRARATSGLRHFRVDPEAGTATRRHGDAWIDAGAFGKGLALARARARLRGTGAAAGLLDFGGQLVAWGAGPGRRRCWSVGVADPTERSRASLRLELCDASASTTSGSERFLVLDRQVRSHVLDPRSGRPAPAWGSVTVVHEDPMVADLLSTALFVMGPREGRRWARRHAIAALFQEVREDGIDRSTTRAMRTLLPREGGAEDDHPREKGHTDR